MAGLEVLFASVQNQLKGPEDVVICCLHWTIIGKGLKCLGTGEQIPKDGKSAKKSELLPPGWNEKQDVYDLQYIQNDTQHIYLLKVIKIDQELLVHFMRMQDETVSDMMLKTSQYASEDISSYDSAFKDVDELQVKFTKAVLEPVLESSGTKTSESHSSKQSQSSEHKDRCNPEIDQDPLRVTQPHRPHASMPHRWVEPDDPFSIGRGDLDPLAGGIGGGMMFDPLRQSRPLRGTNPNAGLPGRLPPGAVPPGARFDPFGPDVGGANPRSGGRVEPDPDHLPPPGFDDMFM